MLISAIPKPRTRFFPASRPTF